MLCCLVPGPGVGKSGVDCKSSVKDEIGSVGFGLVGVRKKGMFVAEAFTISGNWLALGGAVPPGPARLQMSMH